MNFYKNIAAIGLLTIAIFNSSCENFFDQVIDVDPPEHEKKLVLNCFQSTTDTAIFISVTRSKGILENVKDSTLHIHDATVEWLENGEVVHTFERDTFMPPPFESEYFVWRYYGKETGGPIATPGKTYEIRVTHPDFPTISATQAAPFPPKIDTVTAKKDTTNTGGFFDGTVNFSITIADPSTEVNFYEIEVNDEFGNSYELTSDDPNTRQSLAYDRILVSDEFFNGKKYVLRVSNGMVNEDRWVVTVRSVSKDYYRFASTALLNSESEYDPFASAVQVFSNVQGGLGLFGLSGETRVVVE